MIGYSEQISVPASGFVVAPTMKGQAELGRWAGLARAACRLLCGDELVVDVPVDEVPNMEVHVVSVTQVGVHQGVVPRRNRGGSRDGDSRAAPPDSSADESERWRWR